MRVKYGKELDVSKFKSFDNQKQLDQIKSKQLAIRKWLLPENMVDVPCCPICEQRLADDDLQIVIHEQEYRVCSICGHTFLNRRLSPSKLRDYFSMEWEYRAQYVDRNLLEQRVNEISIPKLRWALEEYRSEFGRFPERILDVGAGSGHFVQAARICGYLCEGIEINEDSIKFARTHFGIELWNCDLQKEKPTNLGEFDLITFWGVLECVDSPRLMLEGIRHMRSDQCILAVEVPKIYSLSTMLQTRCHNSTVRHMDPIGHFQIYSRRSLEFLFATAGQKPVGVWHFGMDAYELFFQLNLHSSAAVALVPLLNPLQRLFDQAELSDEILMTFAEAPGAR